MTVAEIRDVSGRPDPGNRGSPAPSRLPSSEATDLTQPGDMAGGTAFLGMARPALAGTTGRLGSVTIDEVG
jgi:hypothetical protein